MNSYELKEKAIEKRGYTKYSAAKEAKAAEKGTAKQSITFNGKSYRRSMVKQGSEKPKAAEKSTVPSSERIRSSSLRYGAKAVGRNSATGKSSGNYGKAKSSSASRSGSSSYGKSASRGSSGAFRGGASHGAGKGR